MDVAILRAGGHVREEDLRRMAGQLNGRAAAKNPLPIKNELGRVIGSVRSAEVRGDTLVADVLLNDCLPAVALPEDEDDADTLPEDEDDADTPTVVEGR